ncbi:hypothetical protein H696_01442 [Fonticula alba]|uniref:Uncharacterized protein n=1 Tax=Fonticula alba TaxID=691883 RepID=A0A058ZDK2_FONAL|nr:hypothetical protein H696_01442 [Fonticula alba]KCV72036.1 hypothetical protein H696_01442 [Fonticula alba]|eukprot:XP_009493614.1 hypothetical protein H696_01442 [Fonticula alba]
MSRRPPRTGGFPHTLPPTRRPAARSHVGRAPPPPGVRRALSTLTEKLSRVDKKPRPPKPTAKADKSAGPKAPKGGAAASAAGGAAPASASSGTAPATGPPAGSASGGAPGPKARNEGGKAAASGGSGTAAPSRAKETSSKKRPASSASADQKSGASASDAPAAKRPKSASQPGAQSQGTQAPNAAAGASQAPKRKAAPASKKPARSVSSSPAPAPGPPVPSMVPNLPIIGQPLVTNVLPAPADPAAEPSFSVFHITSPYPGVPPRFLDLSKFSTQLSNQPRPEASRPGEPDPDDLLSLPAFSNLAKLARQLRGTDPDPHAAGSLEPGLLLRQPAAERPAASSPLSIALSVSSSDPNHIIAAGAAASERQARARLFLGRDAEGRSPPEFNHIPRLLPRRLILPEGSALALPLLDDIANADQLPEISLNLATQLPDQLAHVNTRAPVMSALRSRDLDALNAETIQFIERNNDMRGAVRRLYRTLAGDYTNGPLFSPADRRRPLPSPEEVTRALRAAGAEAAAAVAAAAAPGGRARGAAASAEAALQTVPRLAEILSDPVGAGLGPLSPPPPLAGEALAKANFVRDPAALASLTHLCLRSMAASESVVDSLLKTRSLAYHACSSRARIVRVVKKVKRTGATVSGGVGTKSEAGAPAGRGGAGGGAGPPSDHGK